MNSFSYALAPEIYSLASSSSKCALNCLSITSRGSKSSTSHYVSAFAAVNGSDFYHKIALCFHNGMSFSQGHITQNVFRMDWLCATRLMDQRNLGLVGLTGGDRTAAQGEGRERVGWWCSPWGNSCTT